MSNNVSHCGAKVREIPFLLPHFDHEWFNNGGELLKMFYCVLQEPSQLQASALKGSTQQETLMETVARIRKVLLPNVK